MRITLGQAKTEVEAIPNINLAATDTRIVTLINRAQRRIIEESGAQLISRRIRICLDENCITAPFGVSSFTDVAMSDTPMPILNEWYEFLDRGGGVYLDTPADSHGLRLVERGESCLFRDIIGVDKQIKIYTDIVEADGTNIWLYGRDEASRWIRTDPDGTGYVNGERISIAGTGPFTSTKIFSEITGVVKPVTRGMVRLYSLQPSTADERAIAIYEHNEEVPSYQRYLVRGEDVCECEDNATLTAMALMEFVPAAEDNDDLVVYSMEALLLMCSSIQKMQDNKFAEGLALSRESIRRMAMARDKHSPRERTSVEYHIFPKDTLDSHRIGRVY